MALTASDLLKIRHYIPAEWTPVEKFNDAAVFLAFQEFGSVNAAALALTRLKLSMLANEPSSFTVSGEYTQSTAAAINALTTQSRRLEVLVQADTDAASADITVRQAVRIGTPRR